VKKFIVIISIRTKLAAALLLTTAITVAGMYAFVQWSFDRGFLEYINSYQLERLEAFSETLADTYRSDGGWQEITRDHRSWHRFLRSALGEEGEVFASAPSRSENEPQARHLPPPRHVGPPRFELGGPEGHRPPPPPRREGRPPRQHNMPRETRWALMLLDADKEILISRPGDLLEEFKLQPIEVDGALVGYIGTKQPTQVTDQLDLSFAQQQTESLLLISLLIGLLALLVALPLALHLLRPIRKLASGTEALAAGDYTTRIEVKSRDELELLSRNFNTLAHTLEANEQARKRWIADISHELRTPLSVLKGHIEAIQDGIRDASPQTIDVLSNKVNQLTRLVGDLYELALSDLGALTYRKEATDIGELIDDTLRGFEAAFAKKELGLKWKSEIQSGQTLFGDPERLSQLLSNLTKNSLRYTDAGGQLRVKASGNARQAVIEFSDTAPGVDEKDLSKLFDSLFRTDSSRNRSLGGAGLGLAICKSIVEAHGGKISARSSAEGGLYLRIEIPWHG
jgi:two-component system, OmpR family, sensor histidine kinase BaeS